LNRKHHSQTQTRDNFNKSISSKKTSTNSNQNANILSSYSNLPFHFTNKQIDESVRFIPPELKINHKTMFFNMIADPTPHNINSHRQHKKQSFLTDFKAKKLQNSTTFQNIFDMMPEAKRNRYGFVADESLLNLSQNDIVNNESYSFNKKVEKDMKEDNTLFEKEKENNNKSKLINTLINPHSTYRFNFTKKRDFIMGNIKNLEKERQHGSISIDMMKSNCKKIHYEKLKPVDIQSIEEVEDYAKIIKQNKIKSKINQSTNVNIDQDQKITTINKFKKSISKKNDAKISLNEKFPSIYKDILKSNKENENITRKKVTIIYRNSVKKIQPENESKENSTQPKKRIRKERPVNKSLDHLDFIKIPFVNKFLF